MQKNYTKWCKQFLDFQFQHVKNWDLKSTLPKEAMQQWFFPTDQQRDQYRNFQDFLEAVKKENQYTEFDKIDKGRLALILLLDQVSRTIYNDHKQYETDHLAAALTLNYLKFGNPKEYSVIEKSFLVVVLEHQENKFIHYEAQNLVKQLKEESKDYEGLSKWSLKGHRKVWKISTQKQSIRSTREQCRKRFL